MVRLRLRVDLGFTAVSVLNNECRKLACLSNCCPVAKIKTLGCILVSVYSAVEIGLRHTGGVMAVAMSMNREPTEQLLKPSDLNLIKDT